MGKLEKREGPEEKKGVENLVGRGRKRFLKAEKENRGQKRGSDRRKL